MDFSCSSAFVTLAAIDLEKLVLFYGNLLGIKPRHYTPSYAEFQLPGLRLGIFRPKIHQPEFKNSSSAMSLCLEVSDLENAIAQLTDLGYPPPGEILTAAHGKEIYAYDPQGNRLILYQSSGK
ncbi:VOC family protein [Gloeocapsopsis dulcis]|uniref:Glyoxalase n=1 Tax=Gloeocapsopsis dulcis AAB1 = 1H9 TaxID=1433147 RepID=A0A6N8FSS6_9CHRO|nr:VOC family protein [Gloeocapsopsis dulcis]MUL35622.1 glyoxalase [Gloeocapsopsis dulcis AAB1 = 1H9]WNN87476.1 VOC family protein [Gloeocapsopsis dulcis]